MKKNLYFFISVFLVILLAFACNKKDEKSIESALSTSESILKSLFPDLNEREILTMINSLTLNEINDLKAELEKTREEVVKLSKELFKTSQDRVEDRTKDLQLVNNGFPVSLEAIGTNALYNSSTKSLQIQISGIFKNNQNIKINDSTINVTVKGNNVQNKTVYSLNENATVDIVLLLDITGSMNSVIKSVKESVIKFTEILVSSGIKGTIGIVTFQDTVGVNVSFQQPKPKNKFERSPFFEPVQLDNKAKITELKDFIKKLEANRGGDLPENLSGALDFARNNVIGYTSFGQPNVIGDLIEDPVGTSAWPSLKSDFQVFFVFTDATFHSDSRDEKNSDLEKSFIPRKISDILYSLRKTRTIVNVSDPSWVDKSLIPTGNADEKEIDADYWAIKTGGIGEDVILNKYSLLDLELVVVASDSALMDITLDKILNSTCFVDFYDANYTTGETIGLNISKNAETFSDILSPIEY